MGEGVLAAILGSRQRRLPGALPNRRRRAAMSRLRQEEVLLRQLQAAFAADLRGYVAQSDWPSGVLILSKGHFRGIWRCGDGQYSFTPGGYGTATYIAVSAEEAVHYTLDHVCRESRQSTPSI
jgi:hypothetical protein